MSLVASSQMKGAGMQIKHIAAYEAHNPIDLELLELRREDLTTLRRTIFDTATSHLVKDEAKEISARLFVKEDDSTSGGNSMSVGGSANSVTSRTKKVTMSLLSSLGSEEFKSKNSSRSARFKR